MRKHIYILLIAFFSYINSYATDIPYIINDIISIRVSDRLEMREDDDAYTKFMRDTLHYTTNADVVFQQKGLSKKDPRALSQYSRILIQTSYDENGDFPCFNDDQFSYEDINSLVELAELELGPGQEFVTQPKAVILSNASGAKYIKVHYIRTGNKGNVYVNLCFFFNYYYATKICLSYRLSESDIWSDVISEAIDSFKWNETYISDSYPIEDEIVSSDKHKTTNNDFILGIIVGCVLMALAGIIIFFIRQSSRKEQHENVVNNILRIRDLSKERKYVSAEKLINETRPLVSEKDPELQKSLESTIVEIQEQKDEYSESLIQDLSLAQNAFVAGNIDEANEQINSVVSKLGNETPIDIKSKINRKILETEIQYKKGISPEQQIEHVKYSSPSDSELKLRDGFYATAKFPAINTIVFPYRRKKTERRGFVEESFEKILRSSLSCFNGILVLGDVSILPSEGAHPYEPDIAIIETDSQLGLRIDIEIDEPYSGYDKKPIHYIGCGDNYRDENLVNMGWIVLRFSEKQIHKEASQCVSFIRYIISRLITPNKLQPFASPSYDKRWTKVEAEIMAARRFRENLLNHEFGSMPSSAISSSDIKQTDLEKQASKQLAPLKYKEKTYSNIDRSNIAFEQDRRLAFEPLEHIYIYNGSLTLESVSNVVSSFFKPFDTIRWSNHVARRDHREQCEVIEDWDSKGAESREIGTYLHSQIESYFNGKDICKETIFDYDGEYIQIHKTVSIEKEFDYFLQFISDSGIMPFRTEWHIYDLQHRIAGTIDLLCRNGNKYDIYDWKRSRKATPNQEIWDYGINGLTHIPDISFYHYALQQNIYKYILENNYGLSINKMFIVILHPIYGNYQKYEIPDLKREVQIILNNMK